MADDHSSTLLTRWRDGDQRAAAELFQRYADHLVALARSRLPAKLSGRLDAEDVVQSVYRSFFADAREGRYELQRGGDLWHLLVAITMHKVGEQVRFNSRNKRSFQREEPFGSEDSLVGLHPQRLAKSPSLPEALGLTELLEQLMQQLEPLHRRMLELRLQGNTLDEIAVTTGRSQRTVRRVLEQVKVYLEKRQASAS